MEFEKRKLAVLATMTSPEPDKSPKGSIDTPIIPLLNTLNSHPSYFTTSSCSGRISIFSHPPTTTAAAKKKAKGGTWVFISHEPANPDSVLNILNESTQGDTLVFRFEPLIIAIECKDLSSAQSLITLAIASGFRESGITSVNKRVIIAIRCSIRLEVPLGDTQKLMVTHEYLRYLIEVANEKMEANRRRTDSFLQTLLKNGFSDSADSGIPESLQNFEDNGGDGDVDSGKKDDDDTHCGSKIISLTKMDIDGEPLERLFLWGHSACVLENINGSKIIVFGGFGGIGRHSRRNDSLIFDPVLGGVEDIVVKRAPSPRLGHTASMVGDRMFVVGGRGDPTSILNEVWALDIAKSEWRQLQCSGSVFSPRHRHATAVIGSKIYVFGGIHNDVVSSSLFVLDTNNLEWSEIPVQGEWPCPRHSHSMVPYKSSLFMFGGYDGEKALGDLYSFDVETHTWRKENMLGEKPYPRFSHSMFVYNDFVGIIGGCPIKQHCDDLSLLDLKTDFWNNIEVKCIDEGLFVRSTASVVGDELVLIGGGASCYAFGTKFSEPMKMNLLLLIRDNPFVTKKKNDKSDEEKHEKKSKNGRNSCSANWVLKIEKKYAKFGKDLLKKFEWLDLGRKVYAEEGGACICFPITGKFSDLYENKRRSMTEQFELLEGKGVLLKDVSCSTALNLLMAYGASMVPDEVVKVKKERNCPLKIMSEGVASLIERKGLPTQLLEQLPSRWERLGDILVLPTTSFKDPIWDSIGDELWPIIAKSLGGGRLARQGRVAPTGTRDSTLEILVGDNGWVNHRENGILYSFDATKCMFSWGNLSEKHRMANLDCKNEVIVDLFAGIGYFVLPFLVGANAKLVYACEWNPNAIEALRRNVDANSVSDRCIILEGDNRITAPKGIADRVCLGLLPTSEGSWVTAVRALRREGGILHVHGNVKDSEEGSWTEHVTKSIAEISKTEGRCWEVTVEHVERVKWYAPHIRHLVADVRCNQIQNREEIL